MALIVYCCFLSLFFYQLCCYFQLSLFTFCIFFITLHSYKGFYIFCYIAWCWLYSLHIYFNFICFWIDSKEKVGHKLKSPFYCNQSIACKLELETNGVVLSLHFHEPLVEIFFLKVILHLGWLQTFVLPF